MPYKVQPSVKAAPSCTKPLVSYHPSQLACVGAYLCIGTFSVRGSTENDHAIPHLDVRPCTCNPNSHGHAGIVHVHQSWFRADQTFRACPTSLRLSWDQTCIAHQNLQTLGVKTNAIIQLSGQTCTNSVVRNAVTLLLCSSRRSCFRVAFLPTMEVYQCIRPCSLMLSFTIWVTKANSPPGQTISSGVPAQRHTQRFLSDVLERQSSIGTSLWP